MRTQLVHLVRRLLRAIGVELLHRADDPILAQLLVARETLRVTPHLPAWKRDYLLAHLAAQAHIQALLRRLDINLVIDVGANIGQFALGLRTLGYTGRIISFEPQSALCASLHTAAHGDEKWEVQACALGEAPSELKLNVFRDTTLSSLHAANAAGRERFPDYFQLDHTETVAVRPLDDLIATLRLDATDARIHIKTDTQGHDLAVLHGARRVLARSLAVMTEASIKPIYEGAPTYGDMIRYLTDAGFSLSGIYPLAHSEHDMSLIEVDCCFVRPGAFIPR